MEGVSYGSTVAFLGIPFATAGRWQDPQAASWSGQLQATQYGPYCPQSCVLPPGVCPFGQASEACLNLNVYAPSSAQAGAKLPVMVFFYGGGYLIGGQETPLYNGSGLAASPDNPVVVVAINYRVGALGFFKYGNVSGNFGMKDQIFSLQWVQQNIASFGGDPGNVMVFGQSAGGMSTMTMLLSPLAAGLFHKVAIHSDPIDLAYMTQAEIEEMSGQLIKLLDCPLSATDLSCMYAKSADAIVKAQIPAVAVDPDILKAVFQTGAPWEPWVDGQVLAGQPLELLPKGQFNKVPVMLGSVNNEGTMFVYGALPALDGAEYLTALEYIFGAALTPTVHKMYPTLAPGLDNRAQLSQLLTDYVFVCPIRNASASLAKYVPTYLWHFNHSIDDEAVWGPDFAACAAPGQVCHGSELPFVFQSLAAAGATWGPGELALSQLMVQQWTNFAVSSKPNRPAVPSQPIWVGYSPSDQNDYLFQIGSYGMELNYRSFYCDQWDEIGYGHGSYYGESS